MIYRVKMRCTDSATAAFTEQERSEIAQLFIPRVENGEPGPEQLMAFSFEEHGQEWRVLVDKPTWTFFVMTKAELERKMRQLNLVFHRGE
jgi:hypothetical protein